LAKKVLLKKERILNGLNSEERFKKSINLILRRGFSYGVAKNAFEEFNKIS
jgi:SOS response regulatory protein OraA/RecX